MNNEKKMIMAGIIITILVLIVGGYFLFFKPPVSRPTSSEINTPQTQPVQTPPPKKPTDEIPIQSETDLSLLNLDLNTSDEEVRQLALPCSSNPLWHQWLKNEGLIRRFVAIIVNIADGESPANLLDFLIIIKKFSTIEKRGRSFISQASYQRYDPWVQALASLDLSCCTRLFKRLQPTWEKAFSELGFPERTFYQQFQQAIKLVLTTPIIEGDIEVEKGVISYVLVDPKLQELNPMQKHLLRFGPANLKKIKSLLREFSHQISIPIDY